MASRKSSRGAGGSPSPGSKRENLSTEVLIYPKWFFPDEDHKLATFSISTISLLSCRILNL